MAVELEGLIAGCLLALSCGGEHGESILSSLRLDGATVMTGFQHLHTTFQEFPRSLIVFYLDLRMLI